MLFFSYQKEKQSISLEFLGKEIMNEKKIKLELSVKEVNVIFKALGQLPFVEVYEIIGKLNEQANQQLQTEPETQKKLNTKLGK